MANSMTAFGRAVKTVNNKNITVELKSVNSRYLDPTVKISRPFSFLEEKVKADGYLVAYDGMAIDFGNK